MAGHAIMEIYKAAAWQMPDVALKPDDSALTQADLRAHEILANGLAKLAPDVPVVSEEDAASHANRAPGGAFWLIDPLDGTREFIARNGEFTVNIAFVAGGRPVFGVVYAPALNLLYWGGVGAGAFRQRRSEIERITVAPYAHGARTTRVVASKSHLNADTARFITALGPHKLIQAGSSLKFCRIAEGAADVYPRLGPTCEWDTAAAQAVLEAAGGHVTTLDGMPLTYGKPEILNPHFVASAVPITEFPALYD